MVLTELVLLGHEANKTAEMTEVCQLERDAHFSGLSILNAKVISNGLIDTPRPAQHARRGSADHDVIPPHLTTIEHGIKRGHLHASNI